ncbi:hypothetical protein SAMN05421823_11010 [Catalinimonas alkaloidigena]|uniref:Tetratricopeptide repeat-containing protein n=1 Tax=Catalinimonas alkaloidigena TaxID=1075417 RepID=A0A1G9Q1Q4_9BACT|nr:hypothetical protein [Catalinimonas alkaloidigena]SDM04944.1 hypothetical protein SAMN05421823_11010 [Catalinimonas alkaloidigena]
MNYLHKLTEIVTQHIAGQFEFFTKGNLRQKNKLNTLFHAIASQQVRSDAEAERLIYGRNEGSSRYKMLKSRLTDKLENTLLTLDATQLKDYARFSYQCHRALFFCRLLTYFEAFPSAEKLLRKTLRQAQHAQIYEVIYEVARLLRYIYAHQGNETLLDRYHQIAAEASQVLSAEERSMELYQRTIPRMVRSVSYSPEMTAMFRTYADELKPLHQKYPTYRLTTNYLMLETAYYTATFQYEKLLEIQQAREDFLNKYPHFISEGLMLNILLTRASAYSSLKQYDLAEKAINRSIHYVRDGTYNYFVLQRIYLSLTAEAGQYDRFNKLVRLVVRHPQFRQQSLTLRKNFMVYAAYGYYLELIGKTSSPPPAANARPRQRESFINEIPQHHKDKAGYNVALLIVQLLSLLEKGDLDAVDDKINTLALYRGRYLRRPENRRSQLFVRMLEVMIREGFNPKNTRQKTDRYVRQLKELRNYLDVANQNAAEIIPYEKLWEIVLERLQHNQTDILFRRQQFAQGVTVR